MFAPLLAASYLVLVAPVAIATRGVPIGLLIVVGILSVVMHRRGRRSPTHVNDLRLQIAIDLHDDLGSDLGSIVHMADSAERSRDLTEADRRQLQQISALAREALEQLREIVRLVDPERNSVRDMVHRTHAASGPPEDFQLTGREMEILRMLVEGRTKREIASRLFVSHHTIDTHVRNIYEKLHVHSRGGAVAAAVRAGLV